jgi:lipoprotein-anchoring transpeptidase ErfK/SrfK
MTARARSTHRLRKLLLWSGSILVGAILGLQLNSVLTVAAPVTNPGPAPGAEALSTPFSEPSATAPAQSSDMPSRDPVPTATPAPAPLPPTPSASPVATTRATRKPPAPVPAVNKVIVVSLEHQTLTAYDNGKVVLTTLVATGRPALPTPRGTFHIMAKYSPYQFISPWPRSSPYWYPSAWVKYAMLFANDGYFLHDAPWRTVYGPGANTTNGTHGCVNIPVEAMTFLYRWAPVGSTVVVS